jgi:hypothetical protein
MAAAKFKSSIELNVLIGQEGLAHVTQILGLRFTCATSHADSLRNLALHSRGNYNSTRDYLKQLTRDFGREVPFNLPEEALAAGRRAI